MAIVVHKVTGPDAWRFICHAIAAEHRHHEPPTGWKWGYIATNKGRIVGVATVGRAVARALGPRVLEYTRGCTWSRARYGAASAMLDAAAADAKALNQRIVTYTLTVEDGESLRAADWIKDGPPSLPARWCRPSRFAPRRPDEAHCKQRWKPAWRA